MTHARQTEQKHSTKFEHELFKVYKLYVLAMRYLERDCFNVNKDMSNGMISSRMSSLAARVARVKKIVICRNFARGRNLKQPV